MFSKKKFNLVPVSIAKISDLKLFYTILGIILILVIAEIGCKDSDGKTPIDYARERSYNRDTKLIFR